MYKTVAKYKSGLPTINRSLAQARTVTCITHVLVWLVGFRVWVGLTELVSDTLGSRDQKESETNSKSVHLLKHTLDETKNCRNEQQRFEFHIPLAWSLHLNRGSSFTLY